MATGTLHSIDPTTFDIVVAGFSYGDKEKEKEKERSEFRYVKFAEILGMQVFTNAGQGEA